MNAPSRLLDTDASPFERELLSSVLNEPVPPALSAQMSQGLGLTAAPVALTLGAASSGAQSIASSTSVGTAGAGTASTGAAGAGAVSGLGGVKPLFAWLAAAGVGVGGVALWAFAPDQFSDRAEHVSSIAPQTLAQPAVSQAAVPHAQSDQDTLLQAPVAAQSQATAAPQLQASQAQSARVTARSTAAGLAANKSSHVARPTSSSGADVRAELRWLDPARSALALGDSKRALGLLAQYDRNFPRGILQQEARQLRTAAQRLHASGQAP